MFFAPPRRPLALRATLGLVALLLPTLPLGCTPDVEEADSIESDVPEEQLLALGYAEWGTVRDAAQAGAVVHDRDQVSPGINLISANDRFEARLFDRDGNTLHVWSRPKEEKKTRRRSWHEVETLPNGDLIGVVKGARVERLAWDSTVLWSHEISAHHEAFLTQGQLFTLTRERGMLTRPDEGKVEIYTNGVAVLDAATGRLIRHVPLEPFFGSLVSDERIARIVAPGTPNQIRKARDVFHSNALLVLEEDLPGVARKGDVLVSVRELDLLAFLDLEAMRIVWSWGPGTLSRQHHPTLLPNGNLLVFDNRPNDPGSRVLELDPRTREIVWQYEADPPAAFHSPTRGSSFRLPNGNLLIGESDRGRAFEVTRSGRIVWEFFNPEVHRKRKTRRAFYRLERLPWEHFEAGLLEVDPMVSTRR